METIIGSAIRDRNDGKVYKIDKPARHDDVMSVMRDVGIHTMHGEKEQGFWTSEKRFVNREDAFVIASTAGQIIEKTGGVDSKRLYSEDVW